MPEGNFWQRFGTAATVGLVNHVAHNGWGTDPVEDDSPLFGAVEKFASGEITHEQYLNAVTAYKDGLTPLLGQVLWNNKMDIALSVIPGGGYFKGGSVFIKGVGNISRSLFHRTIKPSILKSAGFQNFQHVVGRNPDIFVTKGTIHLRGVGTQYKGRVYNTGLDASRFFK